MTDHQILYIHGFASRVDANHPKYAALTKLGEVSAIAPDYERGRPYVEQLIHQTINTRGTTLLVGTSMGGWLAARAASQHGIPFVALNPCLQPHITLAQLGGSTAGQRRARQIASYDDFSLDAKGLVIVELGDALLDSRDTAQRLADHYPVIMLEGGSHQFEQLDLMVSHVATFLHTPNS
ncbi:YqiA/YcfP family alpha/beta fold hydrolase [Halopseudomonas sp.]|uniref:YqiA/YcfP family alpha/beta fold hydrolase n=1 Tax=Halopseudomonas sp. TaxID=2901191 RepID=UPI003001F4BD